VGNISFDDRYLGILDVMEPVRLIFETTSNSGPIDDAMNEGCTIWGNS